MEKQMLNTNISYSNNTLYIIGGLPGGGKSTYVKRMFADSDMPVLDQDKRALEVYGGFSSSSYIPARRDIISILQNWDANKGSLVWETSLNGTFFDRIVERFRSKGFFIDLTYIFVPDVSVHRERVKQRKENGGHDIPEDTMEKRIERRMANFYKGMLCSDRWQMLYSDKIENKPDFKMVAHGRSDQILIYNQALFNEFNRFSKSLYQKVI